MRGLRFKIERVLLHMVLAIEKMGWGAGRGIEKDLQKSIILEEHHSSLQRKHIHSTFNKLNKL